MIKLVAMLIAYRWAMGFTSQVVKFGKKTGVPISRKDVFARNYNWMYHTLTIPIFERVELVPMKIEIGGSNEKERRS